MITSICAEVARLTQANAPDTYINLIRLVQSLEIEPIWPLLLLREQQFIIHECFMAHFTELIYQTLYCQAKPFFL